MAFLNKVILMAALFTFSLVAGAGCSDSRSERAPEQDGRVPFEFLSQPFNEQDAIAFIGSPLPAGATEVHVTGESALDTIVLVRFDAPMAEVTAWLAELGLTEPLKPGYSPFYSAAPLLSGTADWWAPPAAGSEPPDYDGVYQRVSQKTFNVVVTPLENGLVRVHLQVFNT